MAIKAISIATQERSMPHRLLGFVLFGLIAACSAETPAPTAPTTLPPAATFTAGEDYFLIEPAQPALGADGRIEVVEVFGYSCIHCANLQPEIDAWKPGLPDDVHFEYVPAVFGGVWEAFARAYYTAETMGLLDRTHSALFRAIHEERRPFRNLQDIAGFYADYGVSQEQFLATMASFPVDAKVARARELVPAWGVEATPTMVVAGKYRVPVAHQGGFSRMLRVVDHLVQTERSAQRAR
jgi:protein dithiol oxidoreductase (disulfide-forming)